jgi:hypothetical protein
MGVQVIIRRLNHHVSVHLQWSFGASRHGQTALLAYALWELAGSPHGLSDTFWMMAEKMLGYITHHTPPQQQPPTHHK